MKGAGTCTITASQSGDASWNAAANVTRSFSINKANQSITFGSLFNRTYSDSAFEVSASSSSGLGVSFSTADSGAEFTATTMMSEPIEAGYRVLRIRAESETEGRIRELNVPIRILFDPPAEGAVPVYSGDDGETWRALELLDTPFLPDDREDGYFVSADGRVWVFTRHLSIFGVLARQAVPITVSSTANSMIVGDVTALRAGDCVIEGKKAASDRFIEATGTLSIAVSDPPVVETPVVETPAVEAPPEAAIVTKKPRKKSSTNNSTDSVSGVDQQTSVDDVIETPSVDDGRDPEKGTFDDGRPTGDESDGGGGRNFSMRWVVFGVLGLLILLAVLGVSLRFRRRKL